ncbi:MAG: hypothetical protein ACRENJ_08710 [Candidatus Eiseniibacteriota bacterium]
MGDETSRTRHTVGDLIYDAVFIGGIGGGLVALFFLVIDIMTRGQALFTPSLMGSVLFDRVPAGSVADVSMIAVAKYSVVHLLSFSVLGLAIAYLTHQAEIRSRHPLIVIAVVFAILEVAFWAGASFAIPGVIERLGVLEVAAANLLAAVGVGTYLVATHRGHLWGLAKQRG